MLQGTAMTPFIVILLLCFAVSKAFVCNEYTTFLKLFRMNLDAFPDLRNCSAYLTSLDVSDNQITSIPAEIGTFVNLQELNVNNNLLQELPAEIGQLYNLRTLRVYANKLRQLPVEFRNLTSLQELHAEYNELTSLPMLPNLSMLYVGFNNLTSIPAEYGHLSNLNTLDAYSNPLTCLPRSVKALPNLSSGSFYLPACTNHSIEGFLTNRTAQKGTCGGFASKINGTELGCFDYVHTTCTMNDREVTVTKRWLSDLSSLGLGCAPGAPAVGSEVATYPRCDPATGVAIACAGPNADNSVHRRAGLVTLDFEHGACANFAADVSPTRRLAAELTADVAPAVAELAADVAPAAATAVDAAAPSGLSAAPSLPRSRRTVPTIAAYKAAAEAAQAADLQDKVQALEARALSNVCDTTTQVLYLYSNMNNDITLAPCHESLRELYVYNMDFLQFMPQIALLTNLRRLEVYSCWNMGLPQEFAQLRLLTHLEVHSSALYQWPEVLQRMPQLTRLALTAVNLAELPSWLGKLRNLDSLDLSFNYISDIGDEIGQLPKLRTLIAMFSYVNNVSPAVSRLPQLEALDLSHNTYLRLPAALAEMTQLRNVSLAFCQFTCVPDAVRAMPILADAHYFDDTPSCEAIPRPIGYSQTRNDACLWDAYYGFWYKAACDGAKNKLYVTMYADAACTHQAKRKVSHPLLVHYPQLNQCYYHYGANGVSIASYSYCHN